MLIITCGGCFYLSSVLAFRGLIFELLLVLLGSDMHFLFIGYSQEDMESMGVANVCVLFSV